MYHSLIGVYHKVNILTVDNNVTGEYCINDVDPLVENATAILLHNKEYLEMKISDFTRSEMRILLHDSLLEITISIIKSPFKKVTCFSISIIYLSVGQLLHMQLVKRSI